MTMSNQEINIRTPQPSQQAKILRTLFASHGINVRHTLALEAVAQMSGYANTHVMCAHAPDDADLAKYLQASKEGNALEADDTAVIRQKLADLPSFRSDNYPNIDFEQFLSALSFDYDAYGGFTFTVCFEDDAEKQRVAPFGIVTKHINRRQEGWTNQPLPANLQTVANLQVKVFVRTLATAGVNLTQVYDESPKDLPQ